MADEIVRTIRQLVRRISVHSKHLSREVGLTVPQLVCVKAIGELEDAGESSITVAAVATAVQLSQGTVSRILDRLERSGLVARTRSETDRRKVSLALTEKGRTSYLALPIPLQDRFLERLDQLPDSERSQLLSSLRRIAELMDASDLDAAPLLVDGAEVRADSD